MITDHIHANMDPPEASLELCSVPDCGVKVPEKEPYFNFSCFMDQENFLTSLHDDEMRAMAIDVPSASSCPVPGMPKTTYQRKGKLVYGSVGTTGYNALRSDFETESDNQAELLLGTREHPMESGTYYSDKEDQELCDSLQSAVVDMYNVRLREREWRKRIIREHALVDSKKSYTAHQRLEQIPFGRRGLMILCKFLRFLSGPQLDFVIESLLHQVNLRGRLNSYINYRSQGIKFKSGIKIYESLNKRHLKNFSELQYQSVALSTEIVGGPRSGRKMGAPLVLHNLPGYSLLDEEEKQLCSTVRIVPEAYHHFKQLLVNECQKHDGLKLANARQVIKIDVNKTRKMYDHLMRKKLIWVPK